MGWFDPSTSYASGGMDRETGQNLPGALWQRLMDSLNYLKGVAGTIAFEAGATFAGDVATNPGRLWVKDSARTPTPQGTFLATTQTPSTATDGLAMGDRGAGLTKWLQSYGGALELNPAGNDVTTGAALRATGIVYSDSELRARQSGAARYRVSLSAAASVGGFDSYDDTGGTYIGMKWRSNYHEFYANQGADLALKLFASRGVAIGSTVDPGVDNFLAAGTASYFGFANASGHDLVVCRAASASNTSVGTIRWRGRDTGGGDDVVAAVRGYIQTSHATTPSGKLTLEVATTGGVLTERLSIAEDGGVTAGTAAASQGAGTVNAVGGLFDNGVRVYPANAPIVGATSGGPATAGASQTFYMAPGYAGYNATENNVKTPLPAQGTLRALYVQTSSAQGAAGTQVYTLRKNGADTALTLTVGAGAAAGTFSDVTHSVAVAAGDLLSVKVVNNDGSNNGATTASWSVEFQPT